MTTWRNYQWNVDLIYILRPKFVLCRKMAPKRPNISEKSCQYFFGRLAKALVRQIVDYKDEVPRAKS